MAASAFSYAFMKGSDAVEKKRGSGLASFFSGLCVLAALVLLLGVFGYCYPSVQAGIKDILGGMENGAVRQAFGTLADGLEDGETIRETLARSAQVLFHGEG